MRRAGRIKNIVPMQLISARACFIRVGTPIVYGIRYTGLVKEDNPFLYYLLQETSLS